jgi:hypothetical protein
MMSKVYYFLAIIGWTILFMLAIYQIIDYFSFRNAGARFTAENGQELCLRIQALETKPQPCNYINQQPKR